MTHLLRYLLSWHSCTFEWTFIRALCRLLLSWQINLYMFAFTSSLLILDSLTVCCHSLRHIPSPWQRPSLWVDYSLKDATTAHCHFVEQLPDHCPQNNQHTDFYQNYCILWRSFYWKSMRYADVFLPWTQYHLITTEINSEMMQKNTAWHNTAAEFLLLSGWAIAQDKFITAWSLPGSQWDGGAITPHPEQM